MLALIAFFVGLPAQAMPINEVLDSEVERCRPVLDAEPILMFSLVPEFGFVREAELKSRLSPAGFERITKMIREVAPYAERLYAGQDVIELVEPDLALKAECAGFAKALILGSQMKAYVDQSREKPEKP